MCRGCSELLLVMLVCAKVGCCGGSCRDVPGVWTVETTSGRNYCKTRDFSLPEQLVHVWRRIFNGFFLVLNLFFPRVTVCRFSITHRVTLITPNWGNLQISIGWEVPLMHNWCCFYGSGFFFSSWHSGKLWPSPQHFSALARTMTSGLKARGVA